MTLTIQRYRAVASISIAMVGTTRSPRPLGSYWGGRNRLDGVTRTTGTERGRDVHITLTQRTTNKFPVSKLQSCKIGNWNYS